MMLNFDINNSEHLQKIKTERYIEFCTELNTELISSVQEINIIIKNLFDFKNEDYEIPSDINNLLRSLYKKSSDFNTYMLDLMDDDPIFLPEED